MTDPDLPEMTRTETALLALVNSIASAFSELDLPAPTRNDTLDALFDALGDGEGGRVNIIDGDGEPTEETLAGEQGEAYEIEHRASIEILVKAANPAARDATFDQLLIAIDDALKADRTLDGAVDDARITKVARSNLVTDGLPGMKGAEVTVTLTFLSDRPF